MPLLEVGSMDQVKTGYEVLPEEKKVKVKVLQPDKPEMELRVNKDGKSKTLSFALEVVEGQNKGRRVYWKTILPTSKENYCAWNLKIDGQPASQQQKEDMYQAGDYLRDLKRFAVACGLDTSVDINTTDAYGKELLIDIKQVPHYETGEPTNEARNPRLIK